MRLLPATVVWTGVIASERHRFRTVSVHVGRWLARTRWIMLFLGVVAIVAAELRFSWVESRVFTALASKCTFQLASGPSGSIRYPSAGPYDFQRGYARIPAFSSRLSADGFRIDQQARNSGVSLLLGKLGVYPIYHEKSQAGLAILDRQGKPMYSFRDPERIYPDFESIPPLVVRTLLFIENRHLLDGRLPNENPAIEWDRLGRAVFDFGLHKVDRHHAISGGSTLATQLEKLRHSPEGRTHTATEKMRQMASATLRSYQDGPHTLNAQREVVRDYLNSIPLSATADHGEVAGLGDGLAAWYGADFGQVNRLLSANEDAMGPGEMEERGKAYRQVLSLLLALRRPSSFFEHDRTGLVTETDRYLTGLQKAGLISPRLRDAALRSDPALKSWTSAERKSDFVTNKATNALRVRLLRTFGLDNAYALDRLDLQVDTTIDGTVQRSVTDFFQQIKDPRLSRMAGLNEDRLLSVGDPSQVIYSFTLYERSRGVNLLRAQTDTFNQPLDIVDGSRLQLGSTAKLRTLINYLQIIEDLHRTDSALTPAQLRAQSIPAADRLTLWAQQYMLTTRDRSLEAMLNAALDRTYSGSPGEAFFTAGGRHVFANFDREENYRIMTVREAFEHSVNLVFIRLMRDIVSYYKWRLPNTSPAMLTDGNDPMRTRYLQRFADQEGSVFLRRYYEQYRGLTPDQALDKLIHGIRPSAVRVAVIFRSARPSADFNAFSQFMRSHVTQPFTGRHTLEKLYVDYAQDKFNLSDRGYLAGIHPLELWLIAYLETHPQARLTDVLAASAAERQEVYRWLFRPKARHGQDVRIGTLLEQDAFHEIWKAWKRMGYPFEELTPSYATAIGVSGDTPRALAELAGIVASGGVRYPTATIGKMVFASNTPVETSFSFHPAAGEQVLTPAIAALVREEMLGVVKYGTGRRAYRALPLPRGELIPIAGKTGTGDNRFKVFAKGGGLVAERPVNRTAAFVFIIDDRFFGTVMAFVPGQSASSYRFTSALAVQVFKDLLPALRPLLESAPRN